MEIIKKNQPIRTAEHLVTSRKSKIKIDRTLYLVTSHYSGIETLEESMLHAINREALKSETHKTDEKPPRNGYNGNSNIYSR
jgi:hypothetical protein